MSIPQPEPSDVVVAEAPSVDEQAQFEAIMKVSDPSRMRSQLLALDWDAFERFVSYVFTSAGFTVEHVASDHKRHHVDLRLYDGPAVKGRPYALVEVRHYKTASLRHQSVAAFVGNLVLAGAKRGYLVTTARFTQPAREAAQQAHERGVKVCLTDWRHMARYIGYLRGSRITQGDGGLRTPRPTAPDWLHVADATPRMNPHQTVILAIANNRGGVAKTTSTLSLALALVASERGKRVLVMDLDGQANLTYALPPKPPRGNAVLPPERTIVDFFAGRATLPELVRPTHRQSLWVLPADGELYTRDPGGSADPEAELNFVRALHTLELDTGIPGAGRFDWIIMDTPPAQSAYTRAALAAAHAIIIPTVVEAFAGRSINRIVETAQTMRSLMGRDSRILGSFVVRWPRRPSNQMKSLFAELSTELAARATQQSIALTFFDTVIPEDPRIVTANRRLVSGGMQGIFAFRSSAAARAYRAHLEEVEGRI
jgi:chromosome partitioning protein